LRCIEAWAMVVPWTGFPLRRLLEVLEPTPDAKFVRFEAIYNPDRLPGQRPGAYLDASPPDQIGGMGASSISPYTWPYAEGLRLDKARGALVANVTEGGPAAKAGIEQGDVVIEFDGRPIDEMRKLPRMVAETPIEKEVEVVVWRQGQETTLKVTLGELDETETAALAPADEIVPEGVEGEVGLLGLSLAEMSAEMRQRFELGEETSGVVITAVDEGGSAAEKGLRPGDVIVEVDQQAVVKPRDVDEKVNEAKANGYRVVTLLVYREGDFQWVALRIDQS